ncbi:MAG: beta galactosidase jelly roll domain-containing protein, partial [Mariniphaga sp.]|nr:beta galactosidase jelly roll domain-containing protein [Mariniphaga sp.]
MKNRILFFFGITLLLIFSGCSSKKSDVLFSNATKSPRSKILFDFDWKFHRGDVENGEAVSLNDSLWRLVDLPHDWSVEDLPGTNSPFDSTAIGGIDAGYLVGGTAWYRKEFEVPAKLEGKKLFIYFEGVYMNSDVWLNGEHLGNHPYGYTEFGFDISEKINFGEKNVFAVEVKNKGRNSRWYSGSGIYRHVWITVTNPVYLKKWGTKVTTPVVSESSATVKIETNVINESDTEISLLTTLYDKNGNAVGKDEAQSIESINSININQNIIIKDPELWSPEAPTLYSAVTEIIDANAKVIDKLT